MSVKQALINKCVDQEIERACLIASSNSILNEYAFYLFADICFWIAFHSLLILLCGSLINRFKLKERLLRFDIILYFFPISLFIINITLPIIILILDSYYVKLNMWQMYEDFLHLIYGIDSFWVIFDVGRGS